MKKPFSTIWLTLLLASMLTLAFNIQPVSGSGTIYIRADRSIDPPTAPIQRNGDLYTFTDDIHDSIVVERDNIVVDGTGYVVHGTSAPDTKGISLTRRKNVTIKNVEIRAFWSGIYIATSSNNDIVGNNITNNKNGIGFLFSSHNNITENKLTTNTFGIRVLDSSNYNSIFGNSIVNNGLGIYLSAETSHSGSSNNIISRNNIANNSGGIGLYTSSNNIISGNNIANNMEGIKLARESFNNRFYHNNVINNTQQVLLSDSFNTVWDDGYPSGGNYWSDYAGEDANGDGIGDTPYVINEDNMDRYPLMNPWAPPEHELLTSISAPLSLWLGTSSLLDAIVTNDGLNDEDNVELWLLINGTMMNSTTISVLRAGDSYTLTHLWTPTLEGTYNVTAYAHPVPGETSLENNHVTKFVTVTVPAPPSVQVGVRAGDWIKVDYTVTGWPSGQPYPEWLKVEFLSVEGTSATVRVTMHMSDGTEQNATVPVDVVTGGQALGLSGFVIPANLTTGDTVYITGYGNVTLAGETVRNYAGASRTVVYASFSQFGVQLTYYWDKHTGVMVEASTTSGGTTATAKVTETNMWKASPPPPFWTEWWFWTIIVLIVILGAGSVVVLLRRRKPALPEEVTSAPT